MPRKVTKRKTPKLRIFRPGTPPPVKKPEPIVMVITISLPDRATAPVCFGSEGLADLIHGIGDGRYAGSFAVKEYGGREKVDEFDFRRDW